MSKYILKGTNISVFPFGSIRTTDSNARVLNEQNILKIIKSITDNSSYVIKYDEETDIIEFVLNGYYFVVSISSLLPPPLPEESTAKSIYAYIKMAAADSDTSYKYLTGGDISEPSYTGKGTDDKPYILSEGSYSFTLYKETPQIYFNYTFSEDGSIVFKTLQNISVGEATVTDKKITASKNSDVTFKLTLNKDAARGTASFDVLFAKDDFTAVKFTDNLADINTEEVTHSLHIFDAEYSDEYGWVFITPESSKQKFTATSIDVVNINSGTAEIYIPKE